MKGRLKISALFRPAVSGLGETPLGILMHSGALRDVQLLARARGYRDGPPGNRREAMDYGTW